MKQAAGVAAVWLSVCCYRCVKAGTLEKTVEGDLALFGRSKASLSGAALPDMRASQLAFTTGEMP